VHARNAGYCALIIGPVERADAFRSIGAEGAVRDVTRCAAMSTESFAWSNDAPSWIVLSLRVQRS